MTQVAANGGLLGRTSSLSAVSTVSCVVPCSLPTPIITGCPVTYSGADGSKASLSATFTLAAGRSAPLGLEVIFSTTAGRYCRAITPSDSVSYATATQKVVTIGPSLTSGISGTCTHSPIPGGVALCRAYTFTVWCSTQPRSSVKSLSFCNSRIVHFESKHTDSDARNHM
jgi:hypothetical protein